jgi:hypothetical protein
VVIVSQGCLVRNPDALANDIWCIPVSIRAGRPWLLAICCVLSLPGVTNHFLHSLFVEPELIFPLALRVHTATLLSSAMARGSGGRGSASRAAKTPSARPNKTKAKRERRLVRKKSEEAFAKLFAESDKEASEEPVGSSGSGDDSGSDSGSDALPGAGGEDAKQAEVMAVNPAEQMQLKDLPDSNLVLTCSACGGFSKDSPPKALH